jgi:hypothetical protein
MMTKGAKEGYRNEMTMRIAGFLITTYGWDPDFVLKFLLRWNKTKNRPSLPEREIRSVVKSVVKNGYSYGCNDSLMRSFCNTNECPINPWYKEWYEDWFEEDPEEENPWM